MWIINIPHFTNTVPYILVVGTNLCYFNKHYDIKFERQIMSHILYYDYLTKNIISEKLTKLVIWFISEQ